MLGNKVISDMVLFLVPVLFKGCGGKTGKKKRKNEPVFFVSLLIFFKTTTSYKLFRIIVIIFKEGVNL